MANIVSKVNKLITDKLTSLLSFVSVEKKLTYSEDFDYSNYNDIASVGHLKSYVDTKIADYLVLQDRVLTGLVYSRVDDDVNFTAGTYEIGGIGYSAGSTNFLDLTPSASGLQRYIRFYATTAGTVLKIEGTESIFAELPELPVDTLSLAYILVNDGGIDGDPVVDLTGYAKIDGSNAVGNWPITAADSVKLAGVDVDLDGGYTGVIDFALIVADDGAVRKVSGATLSAWIGGGGGGGQGGTVIQRTKDDLIQDVNGYWYLPMLNEDIEILDVYMAFVIYNNVSMPGVQLDKNYSPNRIYGFLDNSDADIKVTYLGVVNSGVPISFPYTFPFNLS